MRILFAADVPPNPDSGAAGTEYQTVQSLKRLGHEVDVIWRDDLPHKVQHGNLHYVLELPAGYKHTIRRMWENRSYDVVHVNQPHAYLAAIDHKRSGRSGVFVNRSHGWEIRIRDDLEKWRKEFKTPEWRFPRSAIGLVLQKMIARQARLVVEYSDGIIVSCSECHNFLRNQYRLPADQIANIPQASPELYRTAPVKPITSERINHILHVGQFAFFKGYHVLAAGVNNILEKNKNLQFTWVCAEKDHSAAMALFSRKVVERIHFVDWLDQAELMRVYDEHSIFLFPSLSEGFGKVFLEAMARGLCVVSSNTAGAKDLITDGKDGMLFQVGNYREMEEVVSSLISCGDLISKISRASRDTAIKYSWDRVGRETSVFYENLLSLKGVRG